MKESEDRPCHLSVLDYEEQEIVLDVLKHRHIERRREMIVENSGKTLREYKTGHAKAGTSKIKRHALRALLVDIGSHDEVY